MLDGENPSMNGKNSLKRKILLAEDDNDMQIALAENFDAVVTDAVMPNLTGHDLCRILKQNEKFKDVPLIVLSGLEQEVITNVEHDCADAYLVKDAKLKDELAAKLKEVIGAES